MCSTHSLPYQVPACQCFPELFFVPPLTQVLPVTVHGCSLLLLTSSTIPASCHLPPAPGDTDTGKGSAKVLSEVQRPHSIQNAEKKHSGGWHEHRGLGVCLPALTLTAPGALFHYACAQECLCMCAWECLGPLACRDLCTCLTVSR